MSRITASMIFSMALFLVACGSSEGIDDNPFPDVQITPTPTVTPPTEPPTATPYNLARYAVVEASRSFDSTREPIAAIDGIQTDKNGGSRGYTWIPSRKADKICTETDQNVSSDWIKLSWNSQIQVQSIQIFDSARIGAQITGGRITFENEIDASITYPTAPRFGTLPDNALSAVTVAGPSDAITAVTIQLTGNRGKCAGISEIKVIGTRVEEEIIRDNIMLHSSFPLPIGNQPSHSYLAGTVSGFGYNTGVFRLENIKDGDLSGSDANTSLVSANAGSTFFMDIEFDRDYLIDEIILYDRLQSSDSIKYELGYKDVTLDDARWTEGRIVFKDGVAPNLIFQKDASQSSITVVVEPPVNAEGFTIELSGVEDGIDTGLAEVEAYGTYTP